MSDEGRFPAQQGYAWRGDWQQRVRGLLAARGCSTASEFLAHFPTDTLVDLAAELGPGDVAGVQLQWLALDEAKASRQVERLARDLLVRALHAFFPSGWSSPATIDREKFATALSGWTSSITSREKAYRPCLLSMARAMIDENPFPAGWLPASAEDPLLVAFFANHWIEPE